MEIKLHKLARTMPATRAYKQKSTRSAAQLSRELGISQRAASKWRHAGRICDASHARHNLGASTSAADEAIIAELRQRLRLSLDDIVEVLNRCLPKTLSRSAVAGVCGAWI